MISLYMYIFTWGKIGIIYTITIIWGNICKALISRHTEDLEENKIPTLKCPGLDKISNQIISFVVSETKQYKKQFNKLIVTFFSILNTLTLKYRFLSYRELHCLQNDSLKPNIFGTSPIGFSILYFRSKHSTDRQVLAIFHPHKLIEWYKTRTEV